MKYWLFIFLLILLMLVSGKIVSQKNFCFVVVDGDQGFVISDAEVSFSRKPHWAFSPSNGVYVIRRIKKHEDIVVAKNGYIELHVNRHNFTKKSDTIVFSLIPNELEMIKRMEAARDDFIALPIYDTVCVESLNSLDGLILSQIQFSDAVIYHGSQTLCSWGRTFSMYFIFGYESDDCLRARKFIPPKPRNYVVEKYLENLILMFPVIVLSDRQSMGNSKAVSVPVTIQFR